MAKSFTLTLSKVALERLIPDYDVMGKNPAWVKAKVKDLLEIQLSTVDASTQLVEDDTKGEPVRMLISVGGAAEMVLNTLSGQYNVSLSEMARRVICATKVDPLAIKAINPEAESFTYILQKAGYLELRPEQISFYLQNKQSLAEGKIGLSEAATGTGKTISMLIGAAETAIQTNSRVVITVPTISLIHQFKSAYEEPLNDNVLSLREAIEGVLLQDVEIRSIFGRREFVSEFSLRALIQSDDLPDYQANAAKVWLDATVKSKSTNPDDWLINSLNDAVKHYGPFPLDEVRLPALVEKEDHGFLAYRSQMSRQSTHEAEIVIVTHAMLGVDFRSRLFIGAKDDDHQELTALIGQTFQEFISHKRAQKLVKSLPKSMNDVDNALADESVENAATKSAEIHDYEDQRGRVLVRITEENGMIPAFRYLIVDECHQLESNLSRVLSSYVSLRAVGRELKEFNLAGGKVTKQAIKQVNMALKCIVDASPSYDTESKGDDVIIINAKDNQNRYADIIPALRTILNVIDTLPVPAKDLGIEASRLYVGLRSNLSILRAVSAGSYGVLNYSPVRKFPQLTVGRPSIESFLKQLWSFLQGASCVSATIYLPKGDGLTAWYLKSILAIPAHREAEYSPSIGPWIYRPVKTVWQPSKDEAGLLTPPSMKLGKFDKALFDESVKAWHQSVAISISNKILPDNSGGVLTLCTSYQTCEEVGKVLRVLAKDTELVIAKPGFTLSQQKEEFINLRKESKQTVWLTTGAAWTGLDVSGKDMGQSPSEDNMITDLVVPRLPFNTNRSITHQHRKIYHPAISWEMFETCFAFRQALGRLIRRVGLPENRRIWVLDGRLTGVDSARYVIFQKILERYKK